MRPSRDLIRRRSPPELRPIAVLTGAEGAGRLLTFLYYLVAARALAPHGFGVLRYTITLALIGFGVMQVLVTVIGREVGAARGDERRTREILGSTLAAGLALWALSCAACAIFIAAGLTGSADAVGLLAVLSGLAVFQIYYAVARGLGAVTRMAWTYVGGAAIQLASFELLVLVSDPSPRVALLVYALSSAIPVFIYEAVDPVVRGEALVVTRDVLRHMWMLGAPLLAAQVAYVVWNSADQVWVESQLGAADLGLYAAARNLGQLFAVLPAGVIGVVLPRVAELRAHGEDDAARRLVVLATLGTLALSGLLAAVVIAARDPLLEHAYGADFKDAAPPLIGISVAMTLYAGFATLTQSAIGWGRPSVYTLGIAIAAGVEVLALAVLPGDTTAKAAWAYAAGIGVALVVAAAVVLTALRRARR